MRKTPISVFGSMLVLLLLSTGCSINKVGKKYSGLPEYLAGDEWIRAPFEEPAASGQDYNKTNSLTLARVCRLAWETDKMVLHAVSSQWGAQMLFADLPDTDSQYLLLGNSNYTIISFRATQTKFKDILTALKYIPWETPSNSHAIYKGIPPGNAGFRESAADCFAAGIADDVKRFRAANGAEKSPIFITGHSLGGAVALMARQKLEDAGLKADSLYVFGCPVTISFNTNSLAEYQRSFGDTTYFLRHRGDNVPRLRPKNSLYTPPGQSYQLEPSGDLTPYPKYITKNLLTGGAWAFLWLTGKDINHNLQRSYLPALVKSKHM